VPGTFPPDLFPGCLSLMGCLPATAFSQFSRSAPPAPSLECGPSLECKTLLQEGIHANQAHQRHGR
jgi:hypothetical protein